MEASSSWILKASFIPNRNQREPRELVRYRRSIIEERARQHNRIQKVLEGANIKLSSVVSDIMGVSSRDMLSAIADGEDDPQKLASSHNKSTGKRKSAKAKNGNKYLKSALVEAAHSVAASKNHLGAMYRCTAARKGKKRAASSLVLPFSIRWWDSETELINRYMGAIFSGNLEKLREMKASI